MKWEKKAIDAERGVFALVIDGEDIAFAKDETIQRIIDEHEKSEIDNELLGILETILPESCRVRVREGNGPENLIASVTVSVQKLVNVLKSERGARTDDLRQVSDLPSANLRSKVEAFVNEWDAASITLKQSSLAPFVKELRDAINGG